ncbi:MAG: arsenite methyltransferase [Anaerolineales bacterium]|nr:arsenite methyltransferase [Anaerolineales bacterium]
MSTTKMQETSTDIRTMVRKHYGKHAAKFKPVTNSSCCGTNSSCCGPSESSSSSPGKSYKNSCVSDIYETPEVANLPDDVTGLSMGCGDPVTLASLQPGQIVLDLGSGGGIDCFLAAKAVGESGHVIGVDMTPEMLEQARANKAKLGVDNIEFRLGEIEHLPAADDSVDVIISNCVINLSPDKPQVFREAHRVLKPGGRLAVSDIVTDGALPDKVKSSLSAWAGCIASALQAKDYLAAIEAAGFIDVELKPVYWDKSTIDDAMEQLGLDINDESHYKAIFSAKVTARKGGQ